MMLKWCAGSLVFYLLLKPSAAPIMERGLVPFGWMKWPAQEASHTSTTAGTVDRETMTALTAEMPVFSVFQFVWQMEELTTAELRFSTNESGAQCVMMTGKSMMPTGCVVSLVSPAYLLLLAAHDTFRVPILSGWMMSIVAEERLHCLIALVFILHGELLDVTTARMQV